MSAPKSVPQGLEPPLVDVDMRYVVVCGGVCSSLGKGVFSSSLGALMRSRGHRVTHIKIDPYLNPDAGLMSPFEHGEVFVLNDGGEVDLDLGNYERFVSVSLSHEHNITTGKVYRKVLDRERAGKYLGKTVQVVPHLTQMITDTITTVAQRPVDGSGKRPTVCIIELGGTVGDIESGVFLESLRILRWQLAKQHAAHHLFVALCSLIPNMSGQKTKPTQHAVRRLLEAGLSPGLLVCRSPTAVEPATRAKLSNQCSILPSAIISVHDVENLYVVPQLLFSQHVHTMIEQALDLPAPPSLAPARSLRSTPEDITKAALVAKELAHGGVGSPVCSAPPPVPELETVVASNAAVIGPDGLELVGLRALSLDDFADLSRRPCWTSRSVAPDWDRAPGPGSELGTRPVADVVIGIVGKYASDGADTSDAYLSLSKALLHASLAVGCRIETRWVPAERLERQIGTTDAGWPITEPVSVADADAHLHGLHAILVPGGFGARGSDGKIAAIRYARERKVPYLGVCLGMQLAVVEFARSVLGWKCATTSEHYEDPRDLPVEEEGDIATCARYMTTIMPEADCLNLGGTMRLGARKTDLFGSVDISVEAAASLAALDARAGATPTPAASVSGTKAGPVTTMALPMYGNLPVISERHRHRFEINPTHVPALRAAGLVFSGVGDNGRRMICCELPRSHHPFFFAAQFHPEFKSRPMVASPPFRAFVAAAVDAARRDFAITGSIHSDLSASVSGATIPGSPLESYLSAHLEAMASDLAIRGHYSPHLVEERTLGMKE